MLRKTAILTLSLMVLASLPALAAPNFTGTWKLNVSKSDFGQMPPPDSMVRTVKHEEPKLVVNTKQSGQMGEMDTTSNYTTDGKECVNEMMGSQVKSTLKWEGNTLLVNSKLKFQEMDLAIEEKWSLSEDGKTISIAQKVVASMGEFESKVVLEKQ